MTIRVLHAIAEQLMGISMGRFGAKYVIGGKRLVEEGGKGALAHIIFDDWVVPSRLCNLWAASSLPFLQHW